MGEQQRTLGQPDPGHHVRGRKPGTDRAHHRGAGIDDAAPAGRLEGQGHAAAAGAQRPRVVLPVPAVLAPLDDEPPFPGGVPPRLADLVRAAGTSPVHPQQHRGLGGQDAPRFRAPGPPARRHLPVTALATQLPGRLHEQQQSEHARVAVGQPAAGGIERERCRPAGSSRRRGSPPPRPRPQKPSPSRLSSTVMVNES